jgi:hypothetical protein
MGRGSRDQRGQFSTMVRYDGRGRIIPGSNILKKGQKPQEGKWQKKDAYECCNTTTNTTTVNPVAIGTFLEGGIIASDTIIEGRVMIADLNDLGLNVWATGTTFSLGTQAGLTEGQPNTDLILAQGYPTPNAASVCRVGIFDWDLPSKDELNELYVNLTAINAGISESGGEPISNNFYWSSTEFDSNNAWYQDFGFGSQSNFSKNYTYYVRAVRWVNI